MSVELFGDSVPPKGDSVFEFKQLSDIFKYVYFDEKEIYSVIISVCFFNYEEKKLLKILRKYRVVIGYIFDDFKGISFIIC